MTSHPQPYPKGESVKPTVRELRAAEKKYDPLKDYDSPRVEYLVARMERPHR